MSETPDLEDILEAKTFFAKEFGEAPKTAIVLGSGLSPFAESLADAKSVSTKDIPGSAVSTVVGHKGQLVIGNSGSQRIAALAGRVHGYEGHHPNRVVFNLRALRSWGVERFILTNAAGSTQKNIPPGSLVFIRDQINLTAQNALVGSELYGGERFPDMSNLYDREWRSKAKAVGEALSLKVKLAEGVYVGVLGPSYETAAEIQMFSRIGGDLVGMSTVLESVAVHQMGAKVLGISCVTNHCTGVSETALSHEEVIETSTRVREDFIKLISAIIEES